MKKFKIDKEGVEKSKKYMWRWMRERVLNAEPVRRGIWAVLTPLRLGLAGGVAMLLIVALLVGQNLSFFDSQQYTAYASFDLEVSAEDSAGIPEDATFTLSSTEDFSETDIAANLEVSPTVEFEVERVAEGEYEIAPALGLDAATVYNFTINDSSWAYQVKEDFKVYSTIPGDRTTGVIVNTGIEINFSHENWDLDTAREFVDISPSTAGRFERNNKTLIFVPNAGLRDETLYTVTVKKGMLVAGSDLKLGEDYVFQFETGENRGGYNRTTSFTRDTYEIREGEALALTAYGIKPSSDPESASHVKLEIFEFGSEGDFAEALAQVNDVPYWASRSRKNFRHSSDRAKSLGVFEAKLGKSDWQDYFYLPNEFGKGFYLVEIVDGDRDQALLQISNLATYINVSSTDTVVWVNDLASAKPAAGAKVEFEGKSFKADGDGVARFETPGDWEKSYDDQVMRVIRVNSGDDVVYAMASPRTGPNKASEYWYSFGTDRSMYLPKDVVRFWGAIEGRDGKEVKDLRLVLEKGWEVEIDEFEVAVDRGIFIGDIKLDNYLPGSYQVAVYDGEKLLAKHYFRVQDYVKPAYEIDVNTNFAHVFSGDKMTFDVKVQYFEGTPVSLAKVEYNDYLGSGKKTLTVDKNGEGVVSFKAKEGNCSSKYCSNTDWVNVTFESPDAEEANISISETIVVHESRLDMQVQGEAENGVARVEAEVNWVDLSKVNSDSGTKYGDYFGEGAGGRTVRGEITEITWDKVLDGEYYDYINKRTVQNWTYNRDVRFLESFVMDTDGSGMASYEFKINPEAFYEVKLEVSDDDGRVAHEFTTIHGKYSSYNYDYYETNIVNGDQGEYEWMKRFELGDDIDMAVFNGDAVLSDYEGKFMFMDFNGGLLDYQIVDVPRAETSFDQDSLPLLYVQAIWFNGDTYIETYNDMAYFDTESKELNIEVEADKESYEPGEFVTLDVHVTDQDGDGVAADVNLNLVDEAFFKVAYDNLGNPLSQLYGGTNKGVWYSDSSHENPEVASKSELGKGGCFTAETEIMMADGSVKAIKDIVVGDSVLTRAGEFSDELVEGEVLQFFEHYVGEYLVINEDLEVTGVHYVFVNGKWDLASNVKIGDYLLRSDGDLAEVKSVRVVHEPVWVYNFEVDKFHTYFANNFYVHNDKGGDGVRDDFEDTALYESVRTSSNGRASVEFQLPDNITSWRVMAKAINLEDLSAGLDVGNINVTLPMFVDVVANREYSVKDSPIIKMRAYGAELDVDDKLRFDVSVDGSEVENISGRPFVGSYYELPELSRGEHELEVAVSSGGLKDAVGRTIEVKGSRLKQHLIESDPNLKEDENILRSRKGYTMLHFMDGGVGAYYGDLLSLYYKRGVRIDQALTKMAASEILEEYFEEDFYVSDSIVPLSYQRKDGGLSLLPYSDSDLKLTALYLLMDPAAGEKFDKKALLKYFETVLGAADSNVEEVVWALSGMAALNEPVLQSLRLLVDDGKLGDSDWPFVAMAFEKLGSAADASDVFDAEYDDALDVMDRAMYAVVAAGLGDDAANDIWRDSVYEGLEKDLLSLYRLGYVAAKMEKVDRQDVTFKVKVGDKVEKVDLSEKYRYSVMLAPEDDVKVYDIVGTLSYVADYEKEVAPEDYVGDDRISLTRKYFVNGRETDTFAEGDLVRVELRMTEKVFMENDWYMLTDILPSGLRVVSRPWEYWTVIQYGDDGAIVTRPHQVNRQEVQFFYYQNLLRDRSWSYYARVVNPGDFYAEPARVEAVNYPELSNISDEDYVKIVY